MSNHVICANTSLIAVTALVRRSSFEELSPCCIHSLLFSPTDLEGSESTCTDIIDEDLKGIDEHEFSMAIAIGIEQSR